MDHEVKAWLFDIQAAIEEITDFLPEERDFNLFLRDLKTKRAIERNIEIIGEAVKRILSANTTIAISHSRKIVDTRNRIIHGYDTVSDEIIWAIVVRDIPLLEQEVKTLLNNK